MNDAYYMIDRFLRNNLDDDDYAEYSEALDAIAAVPVGEVKPLAWGAFYFGGKRNGKLYSHCDTKEQIEAYIADRHQSDDHNTFRAGPLYTTPPAPHEGWRMVPVEPTPEMVRAARFYAGDPHAVATLYRAMLAASPKVAP